MKKIIIAALLFIAATAHGQKLLVNGWKHTAPAGTLQNLFLYSEQLDNAAWNTGSNISVTTTNVANDFEGNATMDELTVTFASGNTIGQTITVTPGDSIYMEFDVQLPGSGAVTAATYQFYDLSNFNDLATTSYFSSLSTSRTRLRFGILVPAGCTSLICRPFGDVSTTGVIIIGACQIKKVHNYLYVETTSTIYP